MIQYCAPLSSSLSHINEYTVDEESNQIKLLNYYDSAWKGLADETLHQTQPNVALSLAKFLFNIKLNDRLCTLYKFTPPSDHTPYQALKLILHYFSSNNATKLLPGLFHFFKEETHELVAAVKKYQEANLSPLAVALTLNHPSLVQKMIDLDADINEINNAGLSILHQVVKQEGQESNLILKLLLAHPNLQVINHQAPAGYTAFDLAILCYSVDKVKMLLTHPRFKRFASGLSPLNHFYQAPSLSQQTIVRELSIQFGVYPRLPEAQIREKFSAIYQSVQHARSI